MSTQVYLKPIRKPRGLGTHRLTALSVRGPFRGPSGYDHHVREFVRELDRQGVAVELQDLPRWTAVKLPDTLRDAWFDSLDRPIDSNIVLHFTTPQYAIPCSGKRNVNFTMFEATRIPREWVRQNRRHDLVILPTESSRQAWVRSGVSEERIRICPLGIDAARYSTPVEPLDLVLQDGTPVSRYRVRFLNVSELGGRKNLPGLLCAWMAATHPRDDAILMLKTGAWSPGTMEMFQWQLRVCEKKAGKKLSEAAPVLFVRDIYRDADMPRLYAAASHYISTSFGEGWDQAMMEAAASGLRLIAPAHSAYTAYLDSASATLLTSREVPAAFWGEPATAALFQGANWWEPDESEAVASIRAALQGTDGDKVSPRQRILAEFTWAKATERLIQILSEIDSPPRRRWFFR
jgi:glycosyltransferase involved in cell wall biosynthesis